MDTAWGRKHEGTWSFYNICERFITRTLYMVLTTFVVRTLSSVLILFLSCVCVVSERTKC